MLAGTSSPTTRRCTWSISTQTPSQSAVGLSAKISRLANNDAGSHSRSQLPSVYRPAPFCLNCRTNQTLHINLLANYIPSPEVRIYSCTKGMLTYSRTRSIGCGWATSRRTMNHFTKDILSCVNGANHWSVKKSRKRITWHAYKHSEGP